MVPGILLAGEPMGLYIAQEEGPIDRAATFRAAVAGAEFNVAVGLTRLGHRVEYLTRLGCDPDGERIRRALRETGVGDALVITDPERPTGIMFKGRVFRGDPPIFYRRRGSAAAALSREDVERLDLSAFGCLHLTGILPALSPSIPICGPSSGPPPPSWRRPSTGWRPGPTCSFPARARANA